VVAVGGNWQGQLNVSDWTNIKAIAAGEYHTVGLKEDGTVVAVGFNWWGQLDVSDWNNIKQPACALTSLPSFISTLSGISPQLLNSLMAKAENAIKAFDNGNETAAVNILNALLNEVSTQAGKKITADTAATLTIFVQSLTGDIQN